MPLSPQATQLLEYAERVPRIIEREKITSLLEKAGIPIFEPVIAFQEAYGGIVLPPLLIREFRSYVLGFIHPAPVSKPTFCSQVKHALFGPGKPPRNQYLVEGHTILAQENKGRWLFRCAEDWLEDLYYIDQSGELYYLDCVAENSHMESRASSFENFLERKVLYSRLHSLQRIARLNMTMFDHLYAIEHWGLHEFPEAAGGFWSQIWLNESLCAIRDPNDWIELYSKAEMSAGDLVILRESMGRIRQHL